jgi:predicted nucleic acid-binding protein
MSLTTWQVGTVLDSPVYLDANVLVGAVVSNHRLYRQAAQVVGELLAGGATIVISLLVLHESLWALARISYYDLFKLGSKSNFNQGIYAKHCGSIFERYGERMYAVHSMLRGWSEAGVEISSVPKTNAALLEVSDLTPKFMRRCGLAPGDAAHLALAKNHAHTFVTGDGHFTGVAQSDLVEDLIVVHLTGT